jgi:hypothetical protein
MTTIPPIEPVGAAQGAAAQQLVDTLQVNGGVPVLVVILLDALQFADRLLPIAIAQLGLSMVVERPAKGRHHQQQQRPPAPGERPEAHRFGQLDIAQLRQRVSGIHRELVAPASAFFEFSIGESFAQQALDIIIGRVGQQRQTQPLAARRQLLQVMVEAVAPGPLKARIADRQLAVLLAIADGEVTTATQLPLPLGEGTNISSVRVEIHINGRVYDAVRQGRGDRV